MTDDKLRPGRGRTPAKSTPEELARTLSPEHLRVTKDPDDSGVLGTLPQAPQAPPSLEDMAIDATLPAVRRAPPGIEQMGIDATLPAASKRPPKPGDPAVASTLATGVRPARLANIGLKVTLSKAPLLETNVGAAEAAQESGAGFRDTLEIFAPDQVTDPLAKMLGVPDGLINPDGLTHPAPPDTTPVAQAEYAPRYELRDEVGRGGIGRVVLAFDPRLGREVAIKELLPRFASGKSVGVGSTPSAESSRTPAEVRFLDEARITAQLEHPGIVPVHELGQRADGSVYYAMRMVRGRDMKKALAGRGLRERLELLPNYLELCHAIAYAHSRGVVHRDLKPDNVMLGEFGETVVLDWGLAKVRGKKDRRMEALVDEMDQLRKSSGTETIMGAPLGTPVYMPPEQAAGQLELIDARSDVYSLGAILYEILTGRPPHLGTSALEVLQKVQQEDIEPPEQRSREAPPELAAICMRALAREREDRYESAMLLAEDVRRFQVGGLVRAHTYSAWDLALRWLRQHRAAIAAVTALLAVAAGMWWYRGYADTRRRARAEHRRQARVRNEVNQLLTAVARGPEVKNWLDVYTFRLIALKEPLVEQRLLEALAHPKVAVRRLVARSLGGMKSRRAVGPLCARLGNGVESSETVIIAVINALGIIGDSRANDVVSRARFRHGQFGAVWRHTELAFRMIPLPPLPKTGVTANQLVDRGRDTANKGDRSGAMALYTQALALDPKLSRAYVNRAIERNVLGDSKGALADYGRAIALDPKDPVSLHNRSYILRRLGKYSAALADLNRVVASPRHRAMGLQARAVVYRHMGRADDALRDYRAALALEPDRSAIPYNMAFVWADKGDAVRALASLDQALRLQPSYIRALLLRATIRRHRGDLPGALLDAERAVALDPTYRSAYTTRGSVLLARGQRAAAKADFDKAIAVGKPSAEYYASRAVNFHYRLGRYAQSSQDLKQALKLARSDEVAHGYRVLLSAVAVRSGNLVAARKHLVDAVVIRTKVLGENASAVLFLRGELTDAAIVQAAPSYRRHRYYLVFLQGLRAELSGAPLAAQKAYVVASQALRWSSFWHTVAGINVTALGKADPKGILPPTPAPRRRR